MHQVRFLVCVSSRTELYSVFLRVGVQLQPTESHDVRYGAASKRTIRK